MKKEINNNVKVIDTIKNITKDKLFEICENDQLLYGVADALLNKGFITTSSSCGHENSTWKDPIYIAVYLDKTNIKKVLLIIQGIISNFDKKDRQLIDFTFNYSSVLNNDVYEIEYMFGIQINIFENCEEKTRIMNLIKNIVCELDNQEDVILNYNVVYIVNRILNYIKEDTNWINISFNADNIDSQFSLIYKKRQNDNQIIEKDYYFENGLEEFEYIMNY